MFVDSFKRLLVVWFLLFVLVFFKGIFILINWNAKKMKDVFVNLCRFVRNLNYLSGIGVRPRCSTMFTNVYRVVSLCFTTM